MWHTACKWSLAAALFGLLLVPGAALSQRAKQVQDESGLLSPSAISQANKLIATIKERHRKDLFIETVQKGVDKEKASQWARDRFNSSGIDGVYVVISNNPKYYRIQVGDRTDDRHFTPS